MSLYSYKNYSYKKRTSVIAGSWKFFHSEYCNTLVLRLRLILNDKIFSIGIGIVIEFSKLRYWYWYLYWFSKSGVLVLKSVSISEIWNIDIDIGIETWFFRIKYWYWLIQAGIAHLCPAVHGGETLQFTSNGYATSYPSICHV